MTGHLVVRMSRKRMACMHYALVGTVDRHGYSDQQKAATVFLLKFGMQIMTLLELRRIFRGYYSTFHPRVHSIPIYMCIAHNLLCMTTFADN